MATIEFLVKVAGLIRLLVAVTALVNTLRAQRRQANAQVFHTYTAPRTA
jgi:hypothetical protein